MLITPDVLWRFFSYVQRGAVNECWEWTGCCYKSGYGQLSVDSITILSHRLSYQIHFGVDPGILMVCHTCDNPPCINPNHLFLGTNQDNQKDSVMKGRHAGRTGEDSNLAILTWVEVREIRRLYESGLHSQSALAAVFKVNQATISRIVMNRIWKE